MLMPELIISFIDGLFYQAKEGHIWKPPSADLPLCLSINGECYQRSVSVYLFALGSAGNDSQS